MEELNTFHRICPLSGKACREALCEHQCFMDELECQEPERHHHKECPITTLTCRNPLCIGREGHCELHKNPWEQKKFIKELIQEMKHDEPCNTPPPIHIHNYIENIILTEEEHHHRKHRKSLLVLTTLINNQTFIMADIQLTLGATSKGPGIFTLIDTVTGAVLTGVTFSAQTIGANSNPAAATFSFSDPSNNSVDGTPLVAGTGTIAFATQASYTDSTGAAQTNVPFSIVKNFTVLLGADGVSFDVVFP